MKEWEVCEYYGMSKSWLNSQKYHKKFILKKYGEISVQVIDEYLAWQEKLIKLYLGALNNKLVTMREAVDVTYGTHAKVHQGYLMRDRCSTKVNTKFIHFSFLGHLIEFEKYINKKFEIFKGVVNGN